jgi:hypothetical protein
MKTDTPETDALYRDDHRPNLIEHARRLERERDEAREAAEHYRNLYYLPKDGLEAAKNHPLSWENAKAQEELSTITAQRDRLAEALRSIKNELGVPQPEYPAPVANAVKIADEALQSLTPNAKL